MSTGHPTGATGAAASNGAIDPIGAAATNTGGVTATVMPPAADPKAPPKFLRPKFERMPPELKQRPNWVLWVSIWNGSKWTKRPIQLSGFGASTTNPKHWSLFDDAKHAYEHAYKRGYIELREKDKPARRVTVEGVGFVFYGRPDESGLVLAGVDFDKVISGREIASLAEERIRRLGSYTERSVSGTGLHVIVKALPLQSGIAHHGVEIYTHGRFFTMTGYAPENARIVAAPVQLAALAEELQNETSHSAVQKATTPSGDVPFKLSHLKSKPAAAFADLPPELLAEGLEANIEEIRSAVAAIPPSAIATEHEWMRFARAFAFEAAVINKKQESELEEILDTASRGAPGYDEEDNHRRFERYMSEALNRENPITIHTVFHMALDHGWQGWSPAVIGTVSKPDSEEKGPKQSGPVSLADFHAYMPAHNYIFAPSREPWPASSVNARLREIPLFGADGRPLLDGSGKQKKIPASLWLDQNRPVEQMTWAPGLPMVIPDRLISEGGWIERPQVNCLNLYRPPTIEPGNAVEAERWVDHAHKVFGGDADHIVKYLAHRVQRPQEKINHGLVLGGHQGIGKDTLLEPVKHAVGPWNFGEVSPQQMLGRFNGFLKSVILRVNEARDLGDINRFSFYDHMKAYTAAPPDVLRVDEKNLREHSILNCCGVIITTNHKADGIYLPADDRRHFVAWSDLTKDDFVDNYWNKLWGWYENGGFRHVAAYLNVLDLSDFDPKAPPPKTPAFWAIVDANRAPEDAELADVLDRMGNPDATTLEAIRRTASGDFCEWLWDRKNRRVIPYRLEKCGYVQVRNDAAKDGLWVINSSRQVIYAKSELSISDRFKAANEVACGIGPSVK